MDIFTLGSVMTYRDYLQPLHSMAVNGRDVRLLVTIAISCEVIGRPVLESELRPFSFKPSKQIMSTALARLLANDFIYRSQRPARYSVAPAGQRLIDAMLKRSNKYLLNIERIKQDRRDLVELLPIVNRFTSI